jgi:oxygen-independent coproporphyrinogen-3 oxidase
MNSTWTIDASLVARYNKAGPRYTSYPTAVDFTTDFTTADFARALKSEKDQEWSVYIHIPFCESPCFYCGCNKQITRDHTLSKPYLEALFREIDGVAAMRRPKPRVSQIHFGGGTPTFITDIQIASLLSKLRQWFDLDHSDGREFSIEIDPRTVDVERLAQLHHLGFNRISLGIQDLDPKVQAAVNRVQSAEQSFSLIKKAHELGMSGVSVDLIYGLPFQTPESFNNTIDQVIQAKPDRISLYSYAHLPSRFKPQRQIAFDDLPKPEVKLSLLVQAIEALTGAGYVYIGMDHFALENDSMVKAQREGRLQRNFQGYSTHGGLNLLGFGVSAISKVGNVYAQNAKVVAIYEHMINRLGMAIERGVNVTDDDQVRARVIERILCHGALDYSEVESREHIDFERYFGAELEQLKRLEKDGLLHFERRGFALSPMGRLLMRNVAMCFDARLHRHSQAAGTGRFSQSV